MTREIGPLSDESAVRTLDGTILCRDSNDFECCEEYTHTCKILLSESLISIYNLLVTRYSAHYHCFTLSHSLRTVTTTRVVRRYSPLCRSPWRYVDLKEFILYHCAYQSVYMGDIRITTKGVGSLQTKRSGHDLVQGGVPFMWVQMCSTSGHPNRSTSEVCRLGPDISPGKRVEGT